jgi:zinc protease
MSLPVRRLERLASRCAAIALALAGTLAIAQPYTTPPPPAAPRPAGDRRAERAEARQRPAPDRREARGIPLVSAELVALAGAESDPPRLSGLASLSAALMTQGTRRRSAPELAAAAEALGGSLDSGAGWNQSIVSMTVMTPKLDAALALVAEVAREPVFAPEEIERVRTQTLDALKVAYASPGRSPGWSPSGSPTAPARTATRRAERPSRCRASRATTWSPRTGACSARTTRC